MSFLDETVSRLENNIRELKVVEKYLADNMAEPQHVHEVRCKANDIEKVLASLKAEHMRFSQMMRSSDQEYRIAYSNVFVLMSMEQRQVTDQSLSGLTSLVESGLLEAVLREYGVDEDGWRMVASRQGRWDHFSSLSKSVQRSCPKCTSKFALWPVGTTAVGKCTVCQNEYMVIEGVMLLVTAGKVSCGNCGNSMSADGIMDLKNVCCLKCKKASPPIVIGTQVRKVHDENDHAVSSKPRDWVHLEISDSEVMEDSVAYRNLCEELRANVNLTITGQDVYCSPSDVKYVRSVIADYVNISRSRSWREATDNFIRSGVEYEYLRVSQGIPMGVLVGHLRKTGLSVSGRYELNDEVEPRPYILKISSEYADAAMHEIQRFGRQEHREIEVKRIIHE